MARGLALLIGHSRELIGGSLQPKLQESKWEVAKASDDPAVLAQQLANASALIGGMGETNKLLRAAGDRLKLLQVPFVGMEWLDESAVPPGVYVCNVHDQDVGISEYVLSQMLQWACRLHTADAVMRSSCKAAEECGDDAGFYPPFFQEPQPLRRAELFGQTLGIVGFGSIGQAVAARAGAFGMRVVALVGRAQPPPARAPLDWIGTGKVDLERLLRESDFVLLACPLTAHTRGMIGEQELAQMRGHAVLINVARGPVVDEAAFFAALREEQIGGAILDVWWRNPEVAKRQKTCAPSSPNHPFHMLPNVIMTPHISGWTIGREERTLAQVAENLALCADGRPFCNVVCQGAAIADSRL